MMFDIKELTDFANVLADSARKITLAHFRKHYAFTQKADASPVTEVDRATEAALREQITQRYPQHGIIGEELPPLNPQAETLWVLDPIDGTRSFISGNPLFCTLIGVLHRGRAVLGMVDTPAVNQRWFGTDSERGHTAWTQRPRNRFSHVQRVDDLSEAIMVSTTVGIYDEPALLALFRTARFQQLGGDAFAYGCLASGYAHIVADTAMQPHDYLPLLALVRGAGGQISDWQGHDLQPNKDGVWTEAKILASASAELHQQALEVLNANSTNRHQVSTK